jgi:peptide/nickel transport system ATP-binding protein
MITAGDPSAVTVLEVQDLHTYFFSREGIVKAVNGVTFKVNRGEVVGLVGESGCGKSITAFSIIGLIDNPGRVVNGRVLLNGEDLVGLPEHSLRRLRGRRIAMIFQDPMMTLNPVLRVGAQMIEAIRAHEDVDWETAWRRARDALGSVGIASAEERLKAYPHQLSGGMRQRVVIAIAMLHHPDLIIADEPTTALDVTIQGQILHEVQTLIRERDTALVWITHDLSVVAGLADRVAVMYAGRIVESGPVADIIERPLHPYTRGLINSLPGGAQPGERLAQIPGMMPSLIDLPEGCAFQSRCARARHDCRTEPELTTPTTGRSIRCFHPHTTAEHSS